MENTERSCGIWNEAVDKYKSETKTNSLRLGFSSRGTTASAEAILTAIAGNWKDFKDSRTKRKCHLLDVVRPVVKIPGNRKDFEDSRVKRKCLIDALRPVVEVVQLMAEVAGEGASLTFAPGKTIFVAIRILLKASNKVNKSYDSVIDIFESLGSFLGRLTLYLEPNISSLVKEVIIKILARLLSILGVATRLIRETRAVTYFNSLIGKNSEVQAALEKLDKLSAQEGRAAATATLSAASEILSQLETRMKFDQQDANAIKTMLMKIAQEADLISGSSQENQYRSKVHEWLSAPSPVSNNEDNGSVREAGTGSWFLRSTEYNHWKTKSNSLLWVSGGPGSGKSVLSSTIIRDIEFDSAFDSSVSLAYFYFDYRDRAKVCCRGLISSLVHQLASRCSDMPAALERLYDTHRNGMEQPTLHYLVAALKEMIIHITCSVYIVIDALDECSERNNLMALIEEITQWNLDNIHMLITSRKEEDLNRFLMPLSAEVTLKSSVVDRDIAFYIRAVLQNDQAFSKWQPPQKLEIESSLTRSAHGMFRWVSYQLDSIRGCHDARSLTKYLATLPKTTDDKKKPNDEPVSEQENSQQSVAEKEKDPDESLPTPYNMDTPIADWDSKFSDGLADLWTIFVGTCSSLLPISQVRIVVEDSVLDHFTYFRELRKADTDEDLMDVVRRIIEEWKTMGASLIALAALDAAVFGFSRDGAIFTVNEAAKYAIAMSSVADGVGGVVDVCFLIRYSSCDAALFQSYAKDVLKSYLFFSLSSRIPAFSVLVAVTSLAVFMCMVVYPMAPTLVIAFIIFAFIIRFGNHLFWVLYQVARVVTLAMDWVFEKSGVIGRTVLDRISQWFQYIMHQIRP